MQDIPLLTRPGLDNPELTASLQKWMNERYADELAQARGYWQNRRVQVKYNLPYGGWTGVVTDIRMCLADDRLFRLDVKLDRNNKSLLLMEIEVGLTTRTEAEAKAEQAKQDELKARLEEKRNAVAVTVTIPPLKTDELAVRVTKQFAADIEYAVAPWVFSGTDFRIDKNKPADPPPRLSLLNKAVRVRDGRRFGYFLGLGTVTADDIESDLVNVRMALDGKVIQGFRANELAVI